MKMLRMISNFSSKYSRKISLSILLSLLGIAILSSCSNASGQAEEKITQDFEQYLDAYNAGNLEELLDSSCGPINEFFQQMKDKGEDFHVDEPLDEDAFSLKSYDDSEARIVDAKGLDAEGGLILKKVDSMWKVCDSIPIKS